MGSFEGSSWLPIHCPLTEPALSPYHVHSPRQANGMPLRKAGFRLSRQGGEGGVQHVLAPSAQGTP